MPKLLLAFMALLIVSCASTNDVNKTKASANDSYFFDAMTSSRR